MHTDEEGSVEAATDLSASIIRWEGGEWAVVVIQALQSLG